MSATAHGSLPGVCPVDNRWVLKTKRCTDGTIKRLKARLIARGFTQHPGINYFETYAPTAPPRAIRTTTVLAATLNLHLHSIDISNAEEEESHNDSLEAQQQQQQPTQTP